MGLCGCSHHTPKAARGVGDFRLGAPLPIKITNSSSRTTARPRFPRVQGAVVQLGVLEEDLEERQLGVDRALDQHLRQRILMHFCKAPPQRTRCRCDR